MIKIDGIDTYRGGKSGHGTYQQIINEIPPHSTLIVPFLGNCAVVRYMNRPKITICYDRDPVIIRKWKKHTNDIALIAGDSIPELELYDYGSKSTYGPNAVIYCDPPYPRSSRKTQGKLFKYEMDISVHKKLLSALKKQSCRVLISTYDNELYKSELKDWRLKKFMSTTRRGSGEEYLYMNYPKPDSLQDYSFLGNNYRDRERIKKRIKRMMGRIDKLPTLERNAILAKLTHNYTQNENSK